MHLYTFVMYLILRDFIPYNNKKKTGRELVIVTTMARNGNIIAKTGSEN